MKKRILIVLATLAIIASGLLAGCGGTDATQVDALTAEVQAVKTRIDAIEAGIGTVDVKELNNNVVWCVTKIGDLQTAIANISSGDYSQEISALNAEIQDLRDRIIALEASGNGDPVIFSEALYVVTSLTSTSIVLDVVSPDALTVVFEVTFHTTTDYAVGNPGDSINDVLLALYADSPVGVRAGFVNLTPTFILSNDSTDGQWYLERVIFYTQGTAVPEGLTQKTLTVTVDTFGDYVTADVRAVGDTGSTSPW